LELRAKGVTPTRQGGFGYLRGPDDALIENAQAGQVERFNHIHMYHEHPLCAMEWYVTHLGATIPPNPGGAPKPAGDCKQPYAPPTWPSFAKFPGFVRDPSGAVFFDDISISIRPWPGGGLVSTRGHIVDHWALSVSDLTSTVARLKYAADTKRTIPDNSIRVIDMGKYQLAVAVVHRGATGGANAAGATGNAGRGAAAAPNPQAACGERRSGATGPNGIYHDDTAETYVVVSGSGTLITGGTIVNGTRSAADNEVTTILNGPSWNGRMAGYSSRQIKEGDVIVIPEGVPHGFTTIPDHVTYLSV